MRKTIFTLTLFVAGATLLSSCGKYEEGPGLSLLPKKTRLTGTWEADKFVDSNGNESNAEGTVTYEKDGDLSVTQDNITLTGTWEFNGDKSGIKSTFSSGGFSFTGEVDIIRLTNKELITEDADGDQYYYNKQ